jgi:hypothetical protein
LGGWDDRLYERIDWFIQPPTPNTQHPPTPTPTHAETILNIWGDTWHGWLEDELKGLVEAAKNVPLSTYLRILTAPLTADFSDAALLLGRCARSLSQAWQHREKTQFIHAMGNLLLIGFDRGLCPFDGLADARELLALRELGGAQGDGLGSSLNSSLSLSASASGRHVPTPTTTTTTTTAAAAAGTGGPETHGGRRRPSSLKEVKIPRAVFRGRSDGTVAAGAAKKGGVQGQEGEEDGSDNDSDGGGHEEEEEEEEDGDLVAAASRVRVHHTILQYAREMLDDGVLDDVMAFVKADPDCRVIVTGCVRACVRACICVLGFGRVWGCGWVGRE